MVRINVLTLVGVFLGLMCIAVPFLSVTMETSVLLYPSGVGHGTQRCQEYMTSSVFSNPANPWPIDRAEILLAPIAFFLGTALALVTPIGGVGMALGMVEYYLVVGSSSFRIEFLGPGTVFSSSQWGAAFYIGILAAILTLLSFFFPIGPGYSEMCSPWPLHRGHLKERLLVWGKGRKSLGQV